MWSLTRFPADRSRGSRLRRSRWHRTTRAGRPFRRRISPTCRKQQKGLHAKGFEYMRLSDEIEGLISNFERVVDGFLAGLPYDSAGAARFRRPTPPSTYPIADLGLTERRCRSH